jgi:hypothetical protein
MVRAIQRRNTQLVLRSREYAKDKLGYLVTLVFGYFVASPVFAALRRGMPAEYAIRCVRFLLAKHWAGPPQPRDEKGGRSGLACANKTICVRKSG